MVELEGIILTVRKPLNVLKYLEQPHLQIDLINDSPGHYHWLVMGIPIHLLVINELELRPEHYAWLSFAEGKQFETYQEQLSEDVAQDETSQIYIDILRELEKEGKDRMAYEILGRIITEMPPERRGELILNLLREELLLNLPTERLQEILARIPKEQLQKALAVNFDGTTSTDKRETQSN